MPKKVNGFFLFMRDYMDSENKKGRRINLKIAQDEAGKIWPNMTSQEKGVYNERARNSNFQAKEPVKLTTQGIPISQIERQKKEKDNAERLMKKDIEKTVNEAFVNDTLQNEDFFFIAANYFAKNNNNELCVYIPAEIALSKFSLEAGVSKKYHSYVNPGDVLFFGHTFKAQEHSDGTHKLPIPPNAMGETNFGKIIEEIYKFIRDENNPSKSLVIYTHKDYIEMIESILDFLIYESKKDCAEIRVYPLQYLFFTLKKATAEKGESKKPESIHITDALLDRDQHEYAPDISCDFHEKQDNTKYCALSMVVRWGFMFSEYMCNDLALPMLPGYHKPFNAHLDLFGCGNSVASSSIYKIDDDDDDDELTDIKSVTSCVNSEATNPKLERWTSDCATNESILSRDEFPALGRRALKKIRKTPLDDTLTSNTNSTFTFKDKNNDQQEKCVPLLNPLMRKNKIPSEHSFNLSYAANSSSNVDQSKSTKVKSQGRGILLKKFEF